MQLLVTGAAGFIGCKVTEVLLGDGHEVTGLDNLNDAYDVRRKQWRLRRLEGGRVLLSTGWTLRTPAPSAGLLGGRTHIPRLA